MKTTAGKRFCSICGGLTNHDIKEYDSIAGTKFKTVKCLEHRLAAHHLDSFNPEKKDDKNDKTD
jgi:hypothetical protein